MDIGLPVDNLREIIRTCIAGEDRLEITLQAVNRRGRKFHCRITCNALVGPQHTRQGVILMMEEINAEQEEEVTKKN